MDLLVQSLSRIGSDSSLARIALTFSDRAEIVSRHGGPEAAAWAAVYSVLAASAETALLSRRIGIGP
jgi:hypothetical protein